jgi:glycolate oxidase iron-sulfur subunit
LTGIELTEVRRERFDELARQCVSCGLCLPHCPTFDLLAAETDGPRGRIHIMQRLVAAELSIEDARGPLDRCLGCRACETACPSGVQYGEMLEIARDGGAQTPSVQVRTLLAVVRRPRVLALAMRAGRPLARFLPGSAGRSGKSLDAHAAITWERRRAGGPAAVVLRGCVMREAFAGAQQAAVDALAAAGYDVIAGPEQGCCGALHLHNGELAAGEEMRERLLSGVPEGAILVSTAAGCGAALRERDERVLDLSEALVRAPLPPQGSGGGAVAVFDACHLLHAQGVRAAPRELLRGAGYEPVELAGAGRCCGAAGVYAFTQPELSQQLAASRVEAIRESGARVVSCGNPGCALQLRGALREAHLDVRVAHPAELAVEAAS